MKEILLKILGLPATATDEEIYQAVSNLKRTRAAATNIIKQLGLTEAADEDEIIEAIAALKNPAPTAGQKLERRIQDKITESGGALNREQASLAIQHQDEATARLAKKDKAAKK